MDGDPPHAIRPERAPPTEPLPSAEAAARALLNQITAKPPRDETAELRRLVLMRGLVSPAQMEKAEAALRGTPLSLGQVLVTQGAISEAELLSALAHIYNVGIADLAGDQPDTSLAELLPARAAIASEAVIWKRAGSALVIATARPDLCQSLRGFLPNGQRIVTVLASRNHVTEAQRRLYGDHLAREAEGRAPQQHSCRSWQGGPLGRFILAGAALALTTYLLAPIILVKVFFGIAIFVFIANCALKFAAFAQSLRAASQPPPPPDRRGAVPAPTHRLDHRAPVSRTRGRGRLGGPLAAHRLPPRTVGPDPRGGRG